MIRTAYVLIWLAGFALSSVYPNDDPDPAKRIEQLKLDFKFDGEEPTQANFLKTILAPLPAIGKDRPGRPELKLYAALELAASSPDMIQALLACLGDKNKAGQAARYIASLYRMIGTRGKHVQHHAQGFFSEFNPHAGLMDKLTLLQHLLREHKKGLSLHFPQSSLATAFFDSPETRKAASAILCVLREKSIRLHGARDDYTDLHVYLEVMERIDLVQKALIPYRGAGD